MQTILGSGGAIGDLLAKELLNYTKEIRLVSRNPKLVNDTDQLVRADLTNTAEVDKAVQGSSIVYLTAGLQYKTKVWQEQWPTVMRNVIDACIKHNSKLVFFDNTYMYDKNHLSHLTEESPMVACSKKGAVRAHIADMLLAEVAKNRLTAMIARAADFIAPKNSVMVDMVYKNLAAGKKANWMGDINKLHAFTFVTDAAKATALLGNTSTAYNQVWHLPSTSSYSAKQWIEWFAAALQVAPRVSVLPVGMMPVLGLFVPVLREFKEMVYQYQNDYVFSSNKFETTFGLKPTPPHEIVQWVVANLKS
jgi:nucleoside-diphosphate-sugar epimerase